MRIFYIDIDTLRPDHLFCYGYDAHRLETNGGMPVSADVPYAAAVHPGQPYLNEPFKGSGGQQ